MDGMEIGARGAGRDMMGWDWNARIDGSGEMGLREREGERARIKGHLRRSIGTSTVETP